MIRTTSIAVNPRGWGIARALTRATRFTDLLPLAGNHTAALDRALRKLVGDGLAEKDNLGFYRLTTAGHVWLQALLPLLEWVEAHPRNAALPANDPVGGQRV